MLRHGWDSIEGLIILRVGGGTCHDLKWSPRRRRANCNAIGWQATTLLRRGGDSVGQSTVLLWLGIMPPRVCCPAGGGMAYSEGRSSKKSVSRLRSEPAGCCEPRTATYSSKECYST